MTAILTSSQIIYQPLVQASFLFSGLFLCSGFFILKRRWKSEKQISWILTLMSSVVCTITSLPFAVRFFIFRKRDMGLLEYGNQFHTAYSCFFMTYLFLDLVLGCRYYKSRITLMTGWVHHLFYIAALLWFQKMQITSFFTVASILELPTVILAIGSIDRRLRSDTLFALTFFMLRLVAHAWMMVSLKRHHRVEFMWIITLIIYPLHLYWFYGRYFYLYVHIKGGGN